MYRQPNTGNMKTALKHLFARGQHSHVAQRLLLSNLRGVLTRPDKHCLSPVAVSIAQAGHPELLEYLGTFDQVPLANCDQVVHEAASHGSVDILKWWSTNQLPLGGLKRTSIEAAAKNGHILALKWWNSLDPPVAFDFTNSRIIADVVEGGHLYTLRWLKGVLAREHFAFKKEHWVLASANGHVEILQHAKRNSYGFPESTADCIDKAAARGHVSVLDWWYENVGRKLALSYTVDAMDLASAHGHVEVLDWFMQSGLELRFSPAALHLARENAHTHVVEWWGKCRLFNSMVAGICLPINNNVRTPSDFVMLCAFGLSDSLSADAVAKQSRRTLDRALQVACQHGQVNILQLLAPHCDLGNPTSLLHFERAIENNQVSALQWCFRNPPRRGLSAPVWWLACVKTALKRGHIEVLELLNAAKLLSSDSSHNADYVLAACEGGQIRSLKFLDTAVQSTDEWDNELVAKAATAAAANGHVAVLDWLLEEGFSFALIDSTSAINSASAQGHVAILQWWCANSSTFNSPNLRLGMPSRIGTKGSSIGGSAQAKSSVSSHSRC